MRAIWGSLVALLATLALGAPAQAAFPGGNGKLAVQPLRGTGLVLVDGHGHAQRICVDAIVCGRAGAPRWSPDGRAIVFANSVAGRLEIVGANGTCLWCALGAPLASIPGNRPAFTSDGSAVTFAVSASGAQRGLWRAGLDGAAAHLQTGAVSDAVWTRSGKLALVRSGKIWLSGPGAARPRSVGRGTSPSWSPDGTRLAVARSGWVYVIRVRDGFTRKLVAGDSPAWSPNGRSIAFIGGHHFVYAVPAGGGRARRLAAVAGAAVDWQPVPHAAPDRCANGGQVLADDGQAVLSTRSVMSGARSVTEWDACLRVSGRRVTLTSAAADIGYLTQVTGVVLAGRFAALTFSSSDKYFNCARAVRLFDLSNGRATDLTLENWSCALTRPNTSTDSVAVDSSGFAVWRTTNASPAYRPLSAVSCATSSLCVASDQDGNVLTGAGASGWSTLNVYGASQLNATACPSTRLCVAGGQAGDVLSTGDPAAKPAAWRAAHVDDKPVTGVACPSVSLCVAVAGPDVLSTTNPTGGAAAWQTTAKVAPVQGFTAISCPSVSLCVATDAIGEVLTSTDPTGGYSAWTRAAVAFPADGLTAVSCPSASLCVALGASHSWTSTDPTGGASTWKPVSGLGGTAVSCASTSLCVAVDATGHVETSTNPTGGAAAWKVMDVDGSNALSGVSCPTVSFCAAVDHNGNLLHSSNPAGAWSSQGIDLPPCAQSTGCVSEGLYALDDRGTRVVDVVPAGPGNRIGNVSLSGDSVVLHWARDRIVQQTTLR